MRLLSNHTKLVNTKYVVHYCFIVFFFVGGGGDIDILKLFFSTNFTEVLYLPCTRQGVVMDVPDHLEDLMGVSWE